MDNNRNTGGTKSDKFFAGKGFYIVLFMCIAVIAASVWVLVSNPEKANETEVLESELEEPVADVEEEVEILESDAELESTMWEVPEEAEEVLVEVEIPETVSEAISEPETEMSYETTRTFIWPVIGVIEVPYSVNALVYDTTMSDWRTHDGIDVGVQLGEKVMAAASGTVVEVYSDQLYGTTVVIDHGEGLCSIYANLAEVPTVEVGDVVLVGEIIGAVGTTALCETGMPTHLHMAMTLDGESVDPNDYLPVL